MPQQNVFSPLHRALGLPASPITYELLEKAVEAQVPESNNLDYKKELPPEKGLANHDVVKDIAAMANSGGGMIIYGIAEKEKKATELSELEELTERHESAIRRAAMSAINPPVLGLKIQQLHGPSKPVVLTVPPSTQIPHLVYRNDFFGAPIRDDADTHWMKESQLERLYRARFDARQQTTEALDALYDEMASGRDVEHRAWFVGVAVPRQPRVDHKPDRDVARKVFEKARTMTLRHSSRTGIHPLENVNYLNPRPGLRRWIAPNENVAEALRWKESWASISHDGAVALAAAVGGHRKPQEGSHEGWVVESRTLECCVSDLFSLMRETAHAYGTDEYDVAIGIEFETPKPLSIITMSNFGTFYTDNSTPLSGFSRVKATVNAVASDVDFHEALQDLARDVINQGGITGLNAIHSDFLEA